MEEIVKEGAGLEITELRLGLPGGGERDTTTGKPKKRLYCDITPSNEQDDNNREEFITNKIQAVGVVGWPPVCSYRKKKVEAAGAAKMKMFKSVKVSMDGAPFLRKIDISTLKDYEDLSASIDNLFFFHGDEVLKNGDSSDYISIYEDKDGDWMLVGDVPWKMFMESCKRLRIMKKSDAERLKLKC